MLERDDIGYGRRDRYLIAMKKAREPVGEARDDYAIFAELAARLGHGEPTPRAATSMAWLRHLYELSRVKSAEAGVAIRRSTSSGEGMAEAEAESREPVMLRPSAPIPREHPLKTPSGRIEIFSERIASFGYDDCPGHPAWLEPAEWLGAQAAERYPLHLMSNQPAAKLHSQLDHGAVSQATKIKGREPIAMHPDDAAARGIADGDLVRVFNDRGACLAAARRRGPDPPRRGAAVDRRVVRPARAGLQPPLDKHGNPNVLTLDKGASRLARAASPRPAWSRSSASERAPEPPGGGWGGGDRGGRKWEGEEEGGGERGRGGWRGRRRKRWGGGKWWRGEGGGGRRTPINGGPFQGMCAPAGRSTRSIAARQPWLRASPSTCSARASVTSKRFVERRSAIASSWRPIWSRIIMRP